MAMDWNAGWAEVRVRDPAWTVASLQRRLVPLGAWCTEGPADAVPSR
ncbi:MAG: hypothetical protein Kow0092_00700 [Deferrisomatales bacterium]